VAGLKLLTLSSIIYLSGFRESLYDGYFSSILQLAERVLEAFALALHLPEDYFAQFLGKKPMLSLGAYHYPPQLKRHDDNTIGMSTPNWFDTGAKV
jgi:isopenicillin N synthase-like dioxygenase